MGSESLSGITCRFIQVPRKAALQPELLLAIRKTVLSRDTHRFNLNKFRVFARKRLTVKSLPGQSGLPDGEASGIQVG